MGAVSLDVLLAAIIYVCGP